MAAEKTKSIDLSDRVSRVKFMREGGEVKRCHREYQIGRYSVAEHTFGMLCILRVLYPDAPTRVIWEIVGHDIPERATGDFPATSKWFGMINDDTVSEIEIEILSRLEFPVDPIDTPWKRIVKSIDLLELYMWIKDQQVLGNRTLRKMRTRIEKWFADNAEFVPPDVFGLFEDVAHSPWEYHNELCD